MAAAPGRGAASAADQVEVLPIGGLCIWTDCGGAGSDFASEGVLCRILYPRDRDMRELEPDRALIVRLDSGEEMNVVEAELQSCTTSMAHELMHGTSLRPRAAGHAAPEAPARRRPPPPCPARTRCRPRPLPPMDRS